MDINLSIGIDARALVALAALVTLATVAAALALAAFAGMVTQDAHRTGKER